MTTPRTVEEITPAWLTAALSERHPGTIVADLTLEDVMPGMSIKARVRPRYAPGGPPLPETLIVKGHLAAHGFGNSFSYEIEMRSYAEIVPRVAMPTPKCYFAGTGAGGPIVILEDLKPRGVRFLDPTMALDFVQAQAFLAPLARMHATFWDAPELSEERVPRWLSETGELRTQLDSYFRDNVSPATWAARAALPRGTAIPRDLRDQAKAARALERFLAFRQTVPRTLTHGDEHLANFYLERDGSAGFLDWQTRKEPWCVPFAYFLILALDALDRRAWEKELLGFYLVELESAGAPAPDFDAAWQCYRESAIFPYQVWFTNRPEWQPEHFIASATARAAWACWDLGVFELGSA